MASFKKNGIMNKAGWALGGEMTRRRFLRLMAAAGAAAALPAGPAFSSARSPGNQGQALFFSDIHFNPFDNPGLFNALRTSEAEKWPEIFSSGPFKLPVYGSETNYSLLGSMLADASGQAGDAGLVIFGGDFLGHHFNETFFKMGGGDTQDLHGFIKKTISFLAAETSRRFAKAPIFFTLGNNDSYCGDYQIAPCGPFLNDTAPLLSAWLSTGGGGTGSFDDTYPTGGYYAVDAPALGNGVIISLNTIFLSDNYVNTCGEPIDCDLAWVQFEWLQDQLSQARSAGKRVWVLLHIPPGVNVYGTIHKHLDAKGKVTAVQMMWQEHYNKRFLELFSEYSDVMACCFAGHTHMDDFRLLHQGMGSVIISPAVSPIFGNNPAYKILEFDKTALDLLDFKVRFLNLGASEPSWAHEYQFTKAYQADNANSQALLRIHREMQLDARARQAYSRYYNACRISMPAITDKNFKYYWCGISNLESGVFKTCANLPAPR